MKIYTGFEKNWNIEFQYSPLFEVLCSLHVLSKPAHHLERIVWADEMKKKLPEGLYKSLMELGRATCDWCAVMDFCNMYEECNDFNIIEALNYIEDIPINVFNEVFVKYRDYGELSMDEGTKKSMIRAVKEYYLFYFEREMRFIEPLLIRCLRKDSEYCKSAGVLGYINGIHSRIEVTDNAFLFHKHTLFTIPFDTLKRLIVRISSFIDPHLLMDYGEDMMQVTIRAHLDKCIDEVPGDLLRLMKALSDETRLKILRIIKRHRASTQSLAQDLKFTEACISKHLKILYDAELLYKEREGNFIYYYFNTSLLDMIPLGLHEYLEMNIR